MVWALPAHPDSLPPGCPVREKEELRRQVDPTSQADTFHDPGRTRACGELPAPAKLTTPPAQGRGTREHAWLCTSSEVRPG